MTFNIVIYSLIRCQEIVFYDFLIAVAPHFSFMVLFKFWNLE